MTGILLFEHRDYKGKSKVFIGDTSYVGDDFNDKASSIRIIKEEGKMVFYEGNDATKTGYFRLVLRPHALGTVKKVTAKMMRQDPLYFITSNQVQGSTSMTVQSQKKRIEKRMTGQR